MARVRKQPRTNLPPSFLTSCYAKLPLFRYPEGPLPLVNIIYSRHENLHGFLLRKRAFFVPLYSWRSRTFASTIPDLYPFFFLWYLHHRVGSRNAGVFVFHKCPSTGVNFLPVRRGFDNTHWNKPTWWIGDILKGFQTRLGEFGSQLALYAIWMSEKTLYRGGIQGELCYGPGAGSGHAESGSAPRSREMSSQSALLPWEKQQILKLTISRWRMDARFTFVINARTLKHAVMNVSN